MDTDDLPELRPRRSRAVLAVVAVAVLALGAVAAFLTLGSSREPLRVLVAVDADGYWWQGSIASARLLDNVVPHLKALGFDAIDGGDASVVKKVEGAATPEEAARRLGASFVVTGTLKIDAVELGADVGVVEVRAQGPLQLAQIDGPAHELGVIKSWSGAPDKERALKLVSEELGWQTFDVLLPGLLAHEAVQAMIKGPDKIAAGKLTAAATYLEKRDSQLGFAKKVYADLEGSLTAGDRGPSKLTLHGRVDQHDALCVLGASGFLAKSSAIRPFYSPVTHELGSFQELQQLYWQGPDGKNKTVFEGYNVQGYASASPDASTVAYVEDIYGAATALAVVHGTDAPKRVLVTHDVRLSEPKVAAGGAIAAAWGRTCPRCPALVLVVELTSGKELYRSDPKLGALGGFVWLGARRLGVLRRTVPGAATATAKKPHAPAGDDDDDDDLPSQTLEALDFSVTPPTSAVLGSVAGAAALSVPSASGDGQRVVFSRSADDGMSLLLFDAGTGKLDPLPVEYARDPALAPGGDRVALARGSGIEVYTLATKTSVPVARVDGQFSLRYPQFSLDGRRVYFEVRAKDPAFPGERTVSVIASVPAP